VEVPSEALERIRDLYDRGLCRQALDLALSFGPLRQWTGTGARILAGRLASNLGAARLGRGLQITAYRRDSAHLEARPYYAAAVLERFGPYAAWKVLKRFMAAPAADGENIDAQQYLFTLAARVAGTWRDFETAEDWLRCAEQLEPRSPWLFTERAALLEQQDLYEEALATARQSLEIRPWYRAGVQMTAHALQLLDRDEEALDLLQRAARQIESVPVLTQLAGLQMDLERFADALQTLDAIATLSPILDKEHLEWRNVQRARVAYHCGDFARAAQLARQSKEPWWQKFADRLSDPGLSRKRVRLSVHFVRQHHVTCAPATLSALSHFWQRPAEHLEVAEAICYDGTLAPSERRWAEENGYCVREFTITWPAAVALLDRGIPFTLTTVEATSAHLQAVIGYDELRGTLVIRDPYVYYAGEFDAEPLFERHRATGPRGMVIVPQDRGDLLAGLELPDAALYDELYQVQRHLADHARDAAQAVLAQMQAAAPAHRLTLTARRALAAYDANTPALAACLDELLTQFPTDGNLLLTKLGCLRELARRDERLALLERICADPKADPVFWQQLGQELSLDAREQQAAAHWLRRALRYRPLDGMTLATLADCLWAQRNFEEATELYRLAACLDDKKEHPARTYFSAARWLKRTEQALKFLEQRFARLGAKSAWPAITLFEAYCQLERAPEGFAALARARERRPDDGELLLFAADAYARFGKPIEADRLLLQATGRAAQAAVLRATAQVARYRGDLKTALFVWREVLAREPVSLEAHRAVTLLLAEVEGRAAALQHLREVCDRFPHNFMLHQLWADWAREEGAPAAEPVVLRLVAINPADAWSQRELALNWSEQGRIEEALAQAERALRLDPLHPSAYTVRGQIHARLGRLAQAKADYRRAIELAVDSEFAIRELVTACETLAERREALQFIEQELIRQVVFGDGVLAWRDAARAVLPPDEVLASMRLGLKERPDLWHTWSAVLQQLLEMGRLDEALELAREATTRFPLLPRVWLDLAYVQQMRLDATGELQALEQARQINPGWGTAARQLADAHSRRGDFAKALAVLENACAHAPLDAWLQGSAAETLWKLGRKPEAVARVQHALRLHPGYETGWRALRNWTRELGTPEVVTAMARELTERRGGEVRSWLVLAQCLFRPDNGDEAFAALERALQLAPRSVEAHDLRAEMLCLRGRHEEALAACAPEAFGGAVPLDLQARAAWIESRRGRLPAAIQRMRQVVQENPGYYWGWQELADWLWRSERFDEAVEAATQMARLAPLNPIPLGYRADLKLRRGDKAGAEADYARAFQLDPTYVYAGRHLFDLQLEKSEWAEAERTVQVLQQHAPGDEVAACQVRLYSKRWLALQAGPRANQPQDREAARKDLAAALDNFRSLCLSKSQETGPLDMATAALLETGHADKVDATLEEVLREPEAHPHVGVLWINRRLAQHVYAYPKRLNELLARGEIGRRALIAYVKGLGRDRRGWRLRRLVSKHHARLRADDQGWGAVGYALIPLGRYRAVTRWMSDWAQRPGAEMWMLSNLALSLRLLRREAQAHTVVRHALSLPARDDAWRLLQIWFVAEEALAGHTQVAAEHFQQVPEGGLEGYELRLYHLARGLVAVQQAAPELRLQEFRRVRDKVREVFAGIRISRSDAGTRRDYQRYMLRMARDAGSRWQAALIWWRSVVG
jgi:tetratricopeptide (TPR) repeat protein